MAAETQTYLTKAAEAGAVLDLVNAASVTFFATIGAAVQKFQELKQALQIAEITETDRMVWGKFEACFQKFGAMQREGDNIQKAIRDFLAAGFEWQEEHAEMAPVMERAGYSLAPSINEAAL